MVKEWFTGKTGLKFPVDMLEQYGVADNIEQIKEYYKEWIEKYAAAFRKVAENYEQLLSEDEKNTQGGRWYGMDNA